MFRLPTEDLAGTPLGSLTAVVFDTETTGLDTAHDRVIEIGAVRMRHGRVDASNEFSRFVNPGIPIPAASTAIHRITDTDVAAAADFRTVAGAFSEWCGPALLLGYSVGFDVAVLRAECARAEMPWRAPRHLDVAHLVQVLAPNLPNASLETVATWLSVQVVDRHRATADARLTAAVFFALLGRLRDKGIVTLAQAERACQSLTGRMQEEARAGWHGSGEPDHSRLAEFARLDSFPYRHRVRDLMASPPQTLSDTTPLREALAIMVARKISSLFLTNGTNGSPRTTRPAGGPAAVPLGIITERDVLRALHADGAAALDTPVGRYGQRPLVTIPAEEFVYRALSRMSGMKFRHLGVVGEDGSLVGALSARDLLRQRAGDAVSLGDSIERAESPAELGQIWSALTAVTRALDQEQVDARDIATLISQELRELTRRACELAEQEMIAMGRGGPPARYAMMVLGSGGRGESLLAMDQDNAIVFESGAVADADKWFETLGRRVADILNEVGVSYCKGGIMAANREWRMDAENWRQTVQGWIARSKPTDILNCDIFFDAVTVHGDADLADSVRQHALETARGARKFLQLLAMNAGDFTLPIGLFGRLRLRQGRVDLKSGGIMPIFSAARVVALRHGLTARSTPERLRDGLSHGTGTARTVNNLTEAHGILLGLVLGQQLRDISSGVAQSNRVDPTELTSLEKKRLHWALEQISSVHDLLGTPAV